PPEATRGFVAEVLRSRTELGVPIDSQVRALNVGAREIIAAAGEVADRLAISRSVIVEPTLVLLAWADTLAAATVEEVGRFAEHQRERIVHSLLVGVAADPELIGLAPDGRYIPF